MRPRLASPARLPPAALRMLALAAAFALQGGAAARAGDATPTAAEERYASVRARHAGAAGFRADVSMRLTSPRQVSARSAEVAWRRDGRLFARIVSDLEPARGAEGKRLVERSWCDGSDFVTACDTLRQVIRHRGQSGRGVRYFLEAQFLGLALLAPEPSRAGRLASAAFEREGDATLLSVAIERDAPPVRIAERFQFDAETLLLRRFSLEAEPTEAGATEMRLAGGDPLEARASLVEEWREARFDDAIPDDVFRPDVPKEYAKVDAWDFRPLYLGEKAPALPAEDLDGKEAPFAPQAGRATFLVFFATWCPPCRQEVPDLTAMAIEFASRGLDVVAVSHEPRPALAAFARDRGIRYPVRRIAGPSPFPWFTVNGYPTAFLIDRDGRIARAFFGLREPSEVREAVEAALPRD